MTYFLIILVLPFCKINSKKQSFGGERIYIPYILFTSCYQTFVLTFQDSRVIVDFDEDDLPTISEFPSFVQWSSLALFIFESIFKQPIDFLNLSALRFKSQSTVSSIYRSYFFSQTWIRIGRKNIQHQHIANKWSCPSPWKNGRYENIIKPET